LINYFIIFKITINKIVNNKLKNKKCILISNKNENSSFYSYIREINNKKLSIYCAYRYIVVLISKNEKKYKSINFIKPILQFTNLNNYVNISKKSLMIPSFSYIFDSDNLHSEGIVGNLIYFVIANVIIAILFLAVNSYFSLSVKYLDKGGGFECGFTSFMQTRERFNVIFYRVSLLFLVFDLEIILAFPYTGIYQKNANMSKNNLLFFLYILIVGLIYELKEGALNIVKKAHSTEINIEDS